MAIGNGLVIRFFADTSSAVASIGKIETALGRTATSGEKFNQLTRNLGLSFAVVGAVAAGFAAKLAVDGVQAALEDEKSLASLNQTLNNMGFADVSDSVSDTISKMQMLYGVSEESLRPAFERLLRSTGDVATAQKALDLALNTSFGAHKDLETVADALGKAYDGNTGALGRLGIGIDKAVLKSGDLNLITGKMSTMFEGQAATAADTYQGRINRLSVAADEAKEMIGYALLNAVDNMSAAFGGVGGAQEAIVQTGRGIASMIDSLSGLVSSLGGASAATKLKNDQDQFSEDGFRRFLVLIPVAGVYLSQWSQRNEDTARAAYQARNAIAGENSAISGTVAAAIALAPKLSIVTDKTLEGGDAAFYAAKGYIAMFEALLAQERVESDYANTSGTVSSAIGEGVRKGADLTAAKLAEIRAGLEKTTRTASTSSGQVAETFALNWGKASTTVNEALDAIAISIEGKSRIMSEKVNSAFSERLGAFKSILAEQASAIISARKALDDYASSVTDTILGNINFETSGVNAEGKTVPLTPEQIVNMVVGNAANQKSAVEAISKIATLIPEALAQKLIGLTSSDPKGATALADYLANNPAQIERLNSNFNALATFTETSLGIPMATAFAKVGDESAVTMIANAQKKIGASADDFKDWVRRKLKTSISVDVSYNVVGGIPSGASLQARAAGGPVSSGTPYVVGEVGPELFVPSGSGSIIPNNALGGNSYNITVQAGVGDPRAIGQQIVEYITKYERANSPVYASA